MKVHRPTYLLNRNGRYYFRRPIPSELRDAFEGKREFRIALGTSDKAEAQRKVEDHTLETSKRLEAARARVERHPRDTFTTKELQAFANEVKVLWLKQDDEMRLGASPQELQELESATSALIDVVEERPAHRQIRAEAEGLLRLKALPLLRGSQGYWQVVEAVRSGCEEALRVMIAREHGKWSPTPAAAPGCTLRVSQLFEKWAAMRGAERGAPRKSLAEARHALGTLTALHGDLPVVSLTQEHGIALREHCRSLGDPPAAIRKKLGVLRAMLTFAVREGYLQANPFRRVRVPNRETSRTR